MENDHSELFNSEGLSFDSTLESLVDVDYALDDKSFPFDTAYGLPSDILMSAQNTIGSDVSFLDGGATEGNNVEVEVSVGSEFNIASEDGVKTSGDELGENMEVVVDATSTSRLKTNNAENKVPEKNEKAVVQKDENEMKSSGKSLEKAKDSGRKSEHSRRKHSHSDREKSKRSESRHSEQKNEKVEISIEIKEKPSEDVAGNYKNTDQRKESSTKRKAGAEEMMIDSKAIKKCPVAYTTEKMDVNRQNASVIVSTDISVNINESSIEPPAKRMKIGQSESSNDKGVENEKKLLDQNSSKTDKQSQSSRDETKTKERKPEKETKESHNKTDQNRKESSKTSSHKSSREGGHSSKPKSKEDPKSGIKSIDSVGKDEKSLTDSLSQTKQNESKSFGDKCREKSNTSDLKLKDQKDRRPSADKVSDQKSEHNERRPSTEKSSSQKGDQKDRRPSSDKVSDQKSEHNERRPSTDKSSGLKGDHKERRPSKDIAGKEESSNSSHQSKTKEKESKSSKEKLDKKINSSKDKPVEPSVKHNETARENVEVSQMIVNNEKMMNDQRDKQSKLVEKQKINKDKHVEKDLNEEKKKVLEDLQQQLKTLAKLTSKSIPEGSLSSNSEPLKNGEETTKDKSNQSSKVSKPLLTDDNTRKSSKDQTKFNPSGEKNKTIEISEQIDSNQINPNVDQQNDGQGQKNTSSVTDKKAVVNAFKKKIELENELFSAAIGHDLSLSTSSESSSSDKSTGTVIAKSDSSLNESLEAHGKMKEDNTGKSKERPAGKGEASGLGSKEEAAAMGDFNVESKNLDAEFDNNRMNDSRSSDSDAQKEITDNKDIEDMDIASEDMHNDIPTNEGFLEFVTSDIERNLNKKIQENINPGTSSEKMQYDNKSDRNYTDIGFENVEYSESDTDKDLSRDYSNNENEMNVDTEGMKMEDDGNDVADKADRLDRADLESIDSYDDILTAEDYGEDMEEDFELDDDELHGWLEEGVTKESKNVKKRPEDLKEGEYISTEKPILEEKGSNLFDVLPKGWIMLSHNCGMPVYLHKESRVITFSRPYYIGTGSARKHDVPLSSVPCFLYRRELAKEEKANEQKVSNTEQANNATTETRNADEGIAGMPKMTVRSANEAQQTETVTPDDLNKYCRGLFKFNMVEVKRFKTWREKRAHLITEKKKQEAKLPQMAPDTKLLTCQIPDNNVSKKKKKEFVLNPEGKTGVCILHEYTQNVLRQKPTYEFEEIQHAEFPFQATVLLNGIKYGSGIASSKKNAKNEAAKATLRIFFPEIKSFWSDTQSRDNDPDKGLEFFKDIAIDDPRIPDLCTKSSLPQPYQVLHVCLKRNFGLGDTSFKVDKKTLSSQKTEFTLTVGQRTCTVVGKNKREAKQRASQGMLQQLHPELKNWAAIHRLYGNIISIEPMKKDDVFSLDEFNQNRNEKKKNFELLEKLKLAMRKVKENQMNEVNVVTSTISQASSVSL